MRDVTRFGAAQHGELLGQVRGLDAHLREHLGHRVLALAEQLQHPDPGRVAQRLEELRLQLVQRRTHPAASLTRRPPARLRRAPPPAPARGRPARYQAQQFIMLATSQGTGRDRSGRPQRSRQSLPGTAAAPTRPPGTGGQRLVRAGPRAGRRVRASPGGHVPAVVDGLRPAGVGGILPARPGAAAARLAPREEDRGQPPDHQDEDDHGQDEDRASDMDVCGSSHMVPFCGG